jgi:sortase A
VRVARAVGAVGRMMIRAGVLILLFVAYQLWGTGLQTERAQSDLRQQLEEQQAALAAEAPGSPTTGAPTTEPTTEAPTTSAPGERPAGVPAPADLPAPEPGQPIGTISIPDIGADFVMVEGVDLSYLQDGPGHFPGTALPGQPGNAAIAGHRVTWAAPFNRIDELEPGDTVEVETLQGHFTYEVMPQDPGDGSAPIGHYIITPTQVEILEDKGDDRLTLMACHPKYSAAERIVVEARLVSEAAPTTPQLADTPQLGEDAGEGDQAQVLLAGGSGDVLPAVLWSLAAAALWFAAWLAARRWPHVRVVPYLVALPFFAVVLFVAFSHINLLLPAGY